MDAATAKQQVVERIKQANNILVTVSANPSVDQLAACIGITLLLNKMNKHATAVFSGAIPSTVEFLQPEKTIETNTNSLQDFIISLDKAKADKLRYKVEDQMVRIFITPYRTSITDKDLVFSQGDFNVEVILALGVPDQTQIDKAISAHGRILHDATIMALSAGPGKPPALGQINWQEPTASSLCEMLVSISEAFGPGLIDNQMATAFLTGIVAETQRFSNPKTSPKVMTMSAQLMAAGANQQLVISKLEPPPPSPVAPAPAKPAEQQVQAKLNAVPAPGAATPSADVLSIAHEEDKPDIPPPANIDPDEIHIDEQGNLITAEDIQAQQEKRKKALEAPANMPQLSDTPAAKPDALIKSASNRLPDSPTNRQPILTPDAPGQHKLLDPANRQPTMNSTFTANTQPEWFDSTDTTPTDPLSGNDHSETGLLSRGGDTPPAGPPSVDTARSAVDSALGATSLDSAASAPPPASDDIAKAEPPPVPPPIMPAPGLSIQGGGLTATSPPANPPQTPPN